MPSIHELSLLVAVADTGGFTPAARAHGLTTAAVSALVARLEREVGVRLFERTTRVVRPTRAGETMIARVRPMLAAYDEAVEGARGDARELVGRVRVDAPLVLGELVVARAIAGFASAHPRVAVELHLSDDVLPLERERVDLAVRIGSSGSPEHRSRVVARARTCICASPEYLASHGIPRDVAELATHRHIGYAPESGRVFPWAMVVAGEPLAFAPSPFTTARDGLANLALARAGVGLAMELDLHVRGDFARGTLVEVLRELSAPGPEVRLIAPGRGPIVARVRALRDHLARHFA